MNQSMKLNFTFLLVILLFAIRGEFTRSFKGRGYLYVYSSC